MRLVYRWRLDLVLAEYRRLARVGIMHDLETRAPVRSSNIRRALEVNSIKNLIEYLKKRSVRTDLQKMFSWSDSRPDLIKNLEAELTQRPDYQLANLLDSGVEPSDGEYFSAIALVIRQEQERVNSWFNKDYVGGEWYNVGLGKLLRSSDALGTGKSGLKAVRGRIRKFDREADAAAKAFLAAARQKDPKKLEPNHYRLLKGFGARTGRHTHCRGGGRTDRITTGGHGD